MTERLPDFHHPGLRRPQDYRAEEPLLLSAYADLDELILAAGQDEVLDVPAETAPGARNGEANRVRAPVIAEQLWLLGYLDDPANNGLSPDAAQRASFIQAVERFQDEAGLTRDGWTGERTWKALQALVTFDYDTFGERNFTTPAGEPLPALLRALHLRLFALGLLEQRPQAVQDTQVPTQALALFTRLAQRLGIEPPAPHAALQTLIARVFDHDALVRAIAGSSRAIRVGSLMRRGVGRPHRRRRKRLEFAFARTTPPWDGALDVRLERMIVNVAKIGLWLLGFKTRIDGQHDYRARGVQARLRIRANPAIKTALDEFWKRLGGRYNSRHEALAREITPELFEVLAQPQAAASVAPGPIREEDDSRHVSERIRSEEDVNKAYAKGRSLGMRLWDGLKRVWRWIRRGFRKILEIAANLARAFYRYALKAFQIARFATLTVSRTLVQYVKGEIRLPSEIPVRLLLAGDGDVRAVVDNASRREHLELGAQSLHYFGQAFRLTARILAALMRILRNASALLAGGLLGWARFLWVLVRSYREIRPVFRSVRELQRRLDQRLARVSPA